MTEQETHQGPGVYGGSETHRGARHACPGPDCGPQGVRIAPNPDDEGGVLIHFPEVDYMDTQVWSADVGISTDALRELRAAIDVHLAGRAAEHSVHEYLSTGCLHGEHTYCQSMTGQQGKKRPGRCKFCDARCACSCHDGEVGR